MLARARSRQASQRETRRASSRAALAVVAASAALLAGCSSFSDEKNAGPCPRAFALYDASRAVEFVDGVERYSSIGFTAEILDVRTICRYVDAKPIEASLEIDFGFGRGPAAEGSEKTYTYWVAPTRRDAAVLGKQSFQVRAKFGRNQDRVTEREYVNTIVIPRAASEVSGTNFEILVGLELSQEQIDYNRLGKRFTVDAGSGE